jgi:hypothetical protein
MTDVPREVEEEFREALIKYLKANDALSDDSLLLHWYVIAASQSMKDDDTSSISASPNNGNPFAMQLGMVEYARTWLKADLAKCVDD